MITTTLDWQPKLPLKRFFEPTRLDKSAEKAKARFKNHNLPILQYMYNGDPLEPLKCMITGNLGWVDFPCLATGVNKQRLNIDFNHIRQRQLGKCIAGNSVDKSNYDPSAIFRSKYLDRCPELLIEFMAIMPVSQEYHRYITQDSALSHITLKNFSRKYWPWVLKSKRNFDKFCKTYDINGLEYEWFIDHLSNIEHPGLYERVEFESDDNILVDFLSV